MKCVACGSENIDDVRKIVESMSTGTRFTWMEFSIIRTIGDSEKLLKRGYNLFECRDCGFTMLYREKKELQEITSEDVGLVSEIL